MGETGNKEPGGDIAIVDKEETPLQVEIKASNERIKQMDQLQRKLKIKKTMIMKNLKKSQAGDSWLSEGRIRGWNCITDENESRGNCEKCGKAKRI